MFLNSGIPAGKPTACIALFQINSSGCGASGHIYLSQFNELTEGELLDRRRDLIAIDEALAICP